MKRFCHVCGKEIEIWEHTLQSSKGSLRHEDCYKLHCTKVELCLLFTIEAYKPLTWLTAYVVQFSDNGLRVVLEKDNALVWIPIGNITGMKYLEERVEGSKS